MHSWVGGFFVAASQGVGTQIAEGMFKFMQVFLVVLCSSVLQLL